MEHSMGEYVKKLMEVDIKAVELAAKRQKEIESLENSISSEMDKYNEVLLKAREACACLRKERLSSADSDIEKIKKENSLKLQKAGKHFEAVKLKITEEIWQNILKQHNY